ncbi:RsmB/NOP family class I SAM-dependent RNA methyltransferase [Corallococcus sp. BB11-1]|uniref:RsmB/NOP family class I SAM-dependent RNA methyltransferase n=1 Tax=Corallococcus sp. BB11-1 TaxID=2996783 RepID=UPI00226EF62E|nr:RsmB/NOP family class I SAM-dependent RNA methyltransferase [Corallococcus sp. BB11-1]MCY1033211.1 RsmB/NOP family class I SAM-dependent RNA methyltransferase [Corallococcus sp. BB11-1]
MSTVPFNPLFRLSSQPWSALDGLGPVAAEALARILSGEPAERVLDRTLRAHRELSREGRQALKEAVFNVGLWRRRLAFLLGSEEVSPRALLFALLHGLGGVPAADAASWAGLEAPVPLRTGEPPSLALRASLPDWLADHLSRELGPEAEDFCAHLNVPGPITLRVNPARMSREALAARLASEGVATRPGSWSPLALQVEGPRPNLYGLASLREGLFEVQDEGSQLLGLLVEARPGETVLDLCAGAGGKTLQLGAAMADSGRLLAYDPDPERLDRLQQRASRAGLTRVHVLRTPPAPGLGADRVLADVPCSELGSLRRGPDLRFRLTPDVLSRFIPTQRDILAQAADAVRPGGRVVYATCTVNRAENQDVVADFLRARPDFRLVPPGSGWLPAACVQDGFLFVTPHRHGTDGFFAAVLERANAAG